MHRVFPFDQLYRRALPPHLISFTSEEGKAIFKASLDSGHAESYFNLVGNFTTQTDPSYCGLGTLAMVLNALEIDPGKTWKGVWRWYSDEMLECTAPHDIIKEKGIHFNEFACVAKCNGLNVVSKRAAPDDRKDEFIEDVLKSGHSSTEHLVVNFSRAALGQTGIGHFSPIGAVHPGRRLALMLDVARFKYPSYWVSLDALWDAMVRLDPATRLPRGYFVLSRSQRKSQSLIKLSQNYAEHQQLSLQLESVLLNAHADVRRLEHLLKLILDALHQLPSGQFPLAFAHAGTDLTGPGLVQEHLSDIDSLICDIRKLELYQRIRLLYPKEQNQTRLTLGTFFILVCPQTIFSPYPALLPEIQRLRSESSLYDLLTEEATRIKDQYSSFNEYCTCHHK